MSSPQQQQHGAFAHGAVVTPPIVGGRVAGEGGGRMAAGGGVGTNAGGGIVVAGPAVVAGGYCAGGQGGSSGIFSTGGTAYGPAVSNAQATNCCGPLPALGTASGFRADMQAAPVPFRAGANMALSTGMQVDSGTNCGTPWGCAVGEECHGGQGAMMQVKPNSGDWRVETTYTYVGPGQGDVMFVAGKRRSYCGVICCLIVLLILILLIFQEVNTTTRYVPAPATTTAPVAVMPLVAPVETKTCSFWGDPHLVTFDGARPSFYGDGDYWIVKSDVVKIQGRYLGTKYTYGLACVNQVALTGDFVGDHLIFVPTMQDGDIEIDGEVACKELGCVKDLGDGVTVKYNTEGDLVDEAASKFKKHIVHVHSAKRNVNMTIFRWDNYMDLEISMPKVAGMDGSCGNFNDDPTDDTDTAIFARVGARVPAADRLFDDVAKVFFTSEQADILNSANHDQLQAAKTVCKQELEGSDAQPHLLKACMLDQLNGHNEHLLRTAKTFASAKEQAEAGPMSETA